MNKPSGDRRPRRGPGATDRPPRPGRWTFPDGKVPYRLDIPPRSDREVIRRNALKVTENEIVHLVKLNKKDMRSGLQLNHRIETRNKQLHHLRVLCLDLQIDIYMIQQGLRP